MRGYRSGSKPHPRPKGGAATALEKELGRIVGQRWVLKSRLARESYAYDGGVAEGLPDLVALPADRDELAAVASLCYREGVPLVPRGAGTSLSGGPVPVSGGVVVALTRMNRILTLDPENRVALVEPGVTNLELQRAAARWNLMFPTDPASQAMSTLGGNAAENAGGPRAAKYGVTRQHIVGLELVLPDGTVAATGQLDPVPCPDLPRPLLELTSLLAGSEGTLAFITRLALRLAPLPRNHATMLAFFPTMEQAAEAISRMVAARLMPAALEIMGRLDISLAEEHLHLGFPTDAEAMLLVEVDGPGPGLRRQILLAEEIAWQAGGAYIRSATDPGDRDKLWAARRASSGMYGRLKPTYLTLDVTVPRHRVPDMFRKVAELARQTDLPISLLGHMGDGNLHPAVLLDDRCPEELERALQVSRTLVAEALRLGGTLTGEHGIGTEKLEFMPAAFSPSTLEYLSTIKLAFDPRWLLNPGKLIPRPAGHPPDVPASPACRPRPPASGGPPAAGGTTDTERALRELGDALGMGLLTQDSQIAAFGFGGRHRPAAVAVPATGEELAETIRILAARRVPAWPVGSGELARTAFAPFRGGVAVSTANLRRVADITLENLTATLEVGCHPEELDRTLAAGGNCMYAVDCWRAPRSTLGGEIATNACGPGRPRYGATRDNLLGISFVDGRGRVCRVGGQTIKNVSGYDVTRLLCGSWGVLGVLVEATVRLWPRPETERTLAVAVRRPELEGLLKDVSAWGCDGPLQLLSPAPGEDNWVLLIGLAGVHEDVEWWAEQLLGRAHRHRLELRALPEAEAREAWDTARRQAGLAWCRQRQATTDAQARADRDIWVAGYIVLPPSLLPAAAERLYRDAEASPWRPTMNASCSPGTIDFLLEGAGNGVSHVLRRWEGLLAGKGRMGLYGWHDLLEPEVAPWHPLTAYHPATRDLVLRLKQHLDPTGILAPAARLLPVTRE
ncbi:MAG: FAD-linked oxidase C-terminal domain-containing protein [Bacillota bacterium]|nr:FAD-linked oxidase C-terminal domain-containing protein [Bacillota bacterium]